MFKTTLHTVLYVIIYVAILNGRAEKKYNNVATKYEKQLHQPPIKLQEKSERKATKASELKRNNPTMRNPDR